MFFIIYIFNLGTVSELVDKGCMFLHEIPDKEFMARRITARSVRHVLHCIVSV
jgi:hypothetical protein